MEDNITIIVSGNPDLEKNLITSDKEVVIATKTNFTKKNLAYGLIGLLLLSGAVAGIFLLHNHSQPAQAVKSASPLVSAESTEEVQTLEAKAPVKNIKEGPNNNQYVPTTYDLRLQTSSLNCNFDRPDEMLCVGGNWSYTIASTISNTACVQNIRATETPLSSQYLLNCSGLNNKCDILSSREDFEAQLTLVANTGIPSQSCLAYNGLNFNVQPNTCNTQCADGSAPTLSKYNLVSLWDANDDMSATILNVQSHIYNVGPVIALLKHSATVARYSGADANGIFVNDPTDETDFGFRAYKILGWNVAPGDTPIPYWFMANTFSSNWGLNGYMRTTLNEPIIEGFYGYAPAN